MRHLEGLGLFHMDLTLERVRRAVLRLGLERPPFAIVQVVGTNGKGSTATFLAQLAHAHGLRTGLFTSPHFVHPGERIRMNGLPLPLEMWPALANAVMAAEAHLTYFEFLTVLALLAFAEAGVQVAVMEAGLGGRWDATTALAADMLCITPVDMDHQAQLGKTLPAIAAEKAGAMRWNEPVLIAVQQAEVRRVLEEAAHACKASLYSAEVLEPLPQDGPLGLAGPHQRANAQLALAAWRMLAQGRGWQTHVATEARALREAFLPGRFQALPAARGLPPLLLDGAHNAHGMRALRHALRVADLRPAAMIFSCMADKDIHVLLPLAREIAGGSPMLIPTILHNPRAARGEALALRMGPTAQAVPSLREALDRVARTGLCRGDGPVLVCGSLYLLGEFFTLHPRYLIPPVRGEDA